MRGGRREGAGGGESGGDKTLVICSKVTRIQACSNNYRQCSPNTIRNTNPRVAG
jgi:hypothetical protein